MTNNEGEFKMTNEVGVMVGDSDKPNPEEFKVHLRTGEDTAMRHDDFVGSYNHTGRVKLDKKKWTPQKPDSEDNAFKADDWMGSGKTQRKSWQVKSPTNTVKANNDDKPEELVGSSSPTARKWKPPPKDQALPPTGLASPTNSVTKSPRKSWQPPPKPVNESDHAREISVQSEMSVSDLHGASNHSYVQDAVDRLSGSMTHISLSSPKHSDNKKAWQSHSALDHDPRSSYSYNHDESSSAAYEVESDYEAEGSNMTETAPSPPRSSHAADHGIGDHGDKPNPEEYKIHMRTALAGEESALRHDDYVGSYNNTGRVKLDKKKWTPAQKPATEDNVFKSDDWMGSGKTQRKSWQVKSPTKVGKPLEREFGSPSSPTARKWNPPPKDHTMSPPLKSQAAEVKREVASSHLAEKELEKSTIALPQPEKHAMKELANSPGATIEKEEPKIHPVSPKVKPVAPSSFVPAVGFMVGDDDGKPNPEEYKIHMRTVHAGEDSAMRHDDFVGSYNNTGRLKLDKKKWTPTQKPETGDNAFRSEDWMGSGKTQRKSWQVKTPTKVGHPLEDMKPGEFGSPSSPTARKWNPPPNDHTMSPTWMSQAAEVKREAAPSHTVEKELEKPTIAPPYPEEHAKKGPANSPATIEKELVSPKMEPVAPPSSHGASSYVPAVGFMVGDDDGKPNPEEYKIHMRTVHAGEDSAMRHDDFVGSYNNTGRLKLEKKKWAPAQKPETGDNAFRSDDWMGSGAPKKKSWKPKS